MTKVLTIHNTHADLPEFCWATEGEIAIPGIVCDHPDYCGCDRSHDGLSSLKGSTTVMVRTVELDFDRLVTICIASVKRMGITWEAERHARDLVAQSAEAAAEHPEGTVLHPVYDHDTGDWSYHIATTE
jgi:hypothetical protein